MNNINVSKTPFIETAKFMLKFNPISFISIPSISLENTTPAIIPITMATTPIINVSKNNNSPISLFSIPNNAYSPISFFLFFIKKLFEYHINSTENNAITIDAALNAADALELADKAASILGLYCKFLNA